MRRRDVGSASIVVIGVLLGLVVTVAAQGSMGQRGPMGPMGPMGPPGAGAGLPPLFMQVELTEQQRSEIRTLMEGERDARRAAMDERRTLQQQLATAIYGSGADDQQMAQLVARLSELQKQALEADIALQTRVAGLLTDDQKQQIVARANASAAPRERSK